MAYQPCVVPLAPITRTPYLPYKLGLNLGSGQVYKVFRFPPVCMPSRTPLKREGEKRLNILWTCSPCQTSSPTFRGY